MRTSAGSPAVVAPRLLGPRITPGPLDRLAARAVTADEHGLLKYTNAQTVSVQRLLPIAPPGLLPPAGYAKAMTMAMRALQRLPGRT